jgi:DNA-binding response OmpR family regulator
VQVATAVDMLAALEARVKALRKQVLAAARHLTGAKVRATRRRAGARRGAAAAGAAGGAVVHADQVVSRDQLIDELFGDQPGGSAERMLRVQISRLRTALADGGEPRVLARPPARVPAARPGRRAGSGVV